MVEQAPEWLSGGGELPELVISSRARIARNLAGHRFGTRADESEKAVIGSELKEVMGGLKPFKDAAILDVSGMSELDRSFVLERHLASITLLSNGQASSIVVTQREQRSAMLNEEDHLRLQVIRPGLSLEEVCSEVLGITDALGKRVEFAYRESVGYLTACPSNVGTGLRLSVLLHLPGIVYSRDVETLLTELTQSNIVVRGLYGEGSNIQGNIFQVSSRISLGVTEEEILKGFGDAVTRILEHEKRARDRLMEDSKVVVEDKIHRSLALLESARILSFKEAAEFASAVRLGVGLGLLLDYKIRTLNELLLFAQPAHIQKLFSKKMEQRERDEKRAAYIKTKLKAG
jgi:protein arginine kinase